MCPLYEVLHHITAKNASFTHSGTFTKSFPQSFNASQMNYTDINFFL